MPKILVGWNLAIYKLPRFNVFGSEWAMFGAYQKIPEDSIPPVGVKKGRRLPECWSKDINPPESGQDGSEKFRFFVFRLTKSNFRFAKNHRLTKSILKFSFFRFKVTRPLVLMSNLFSGSKLSQERYSFANYKLIFTHASSYFHINERVGIFHCFWKHIWNNYGNITAHSKTIRVSCTFD